MPDWQQSSFTSFDGLIIFYRYREPQRQTQDTLLLMHRGHEHSARMTALADQLSEQNYWCFAFDLRGHGLSQGRRAWAPDFDTWVKDLNSFSGHIYQKFAIKTDDMLLVANSVSSVIAVSWILNYGANVKGCILAAPAFSIKLYIPFALTVLRVISNISSQQFVTSYVRPNLLTRDTLAAQRYDEDPLITKKIGVNVLVTLFEASKNCFRRLRDFETPVLLLTAGNDHIVHNRLHLRFFHQISSTVKKHIFLENFRHAIFFEKEQFKVIIPCKSFIEEAFKFKSKQLPSVITHARPHTLIEYKTLLDDGLNAKQFYFAALRYLLTLVGPCSRGLSIGLEKGFDSGVMLDYVYQNKPIGTNFGGEIIDSIYLNSVGWKGIRTRKVHLKKTLQMLAASLYDQDRMPIILDVASGVGRYLFEVQKEAHFSITLYLNDIDSSSTDKAKALAAEFGSEHCHFTNFDVFSLNPSETISSRPNIIVISGLFELYENNNRVHHVLVNLFSLLQEGGYLIYTGQPWHPQLELIGRILNNSQGKRWVMRRRIQAEIDQLVSSAGFNKLNTLSDESGIFTVSCASKTIHHAK